MFDDLGLTKDDSADAVADLSQPPAKPLDGVDDGIGIRACDLGVDDLRF